MGQNPSGHMWLHGFCSISYTPEISLLRQLHKRFEWIPSEEDVFFPMALSRKQTFRRKVDEKMFLQSWSIDSIVCLVRSINTTKFSVIFL